jgi:sigma-E factor negative regulatory protein RseC
VIEQQGRVVNVQDGFAAIRLGGTGGCASCDAGKGCGAGVFGRLLKRSPMTVNLENTVNARQNQPVLVGIPESLFLKLVARFYLYPLLAGLAGAGAGNYLASQANLGAATVDLFTLLCGLVSGMLILIRLRTNPREFRASNMVHLLRVIETRK